MTEKINIAELLKDCPKGMELDCLLYDNVTFERFDVEQNRCYFKAGPADTFWTTCYGKVNGSPFGKCVIFPKGKTTWEGFVPPCEFKDGDVLFVDCSDDEEDKSYQYIFILNKPEFLGKWHSYCMLDGVGNFQSHETYLTDEEYHPRFATKEEKQKLFDAIKENGYKWNYENKTLKKLEDIKDKGNISDGYHTFNELYEYRLLYNASMFNELTKQGLYDVHKSKLHSDGTIPFGDDNWFIVQAELPTGQISNHYEMKDWDLFQVPIKEKANQYDGHTPQDVAKRLRDFLTLKKIPKFEVGDVIQDITGICKVKITEVNVEDEYYLYKSLNINGIGSITFNRQDDWKLASDKFDINNLKPFDKVLVRDNNEQFWTCDWFSFHDTKQVYPFACVGHYVSQCIPYEGNEHLLGTTNDCDNFFKTW